MSQMQPHEIVWTPEKAEQFWDYFSTDPIFSRQYFSNHSGGLLLEHLAGVVALKGRVLDYGCGPGYMIGHLLDHGIACEGLDFSSASIERVRAKFASRTLFRGATVASGIPTSLPEDSIDVLLSIEMVEHLFDEHLAPTFSEFRRLLRPGATLVVTTPNEEDLSALRALCPDCGCVFHQYQHVRTWSAATLRAALEGHGFQTLRCYSTLIAPQPKLSGLRKTLRRLLGGPQPPTPHLIYIGRKAL